MVMIFIENVNFVHIDGVKDIRWKYQFELSPTFAYPGQTKQQNVSPENFTSDFTLWQFFCLRLYELDVSTFSFEVSV